MVIWVYVYVKQYIDSKLWYAFYTLHMLSLSYNKYKTSIFLFF